MTKKLVLLGLLVATLASVAWGMNGYLMFDLRTLENGAPNFSIIGAGLVPRIPCLGMNAISTEIVSFQNTIFVEVGVGWGLKQCNWILMTGPALVDGFPGWFGTVNFHSGNPHGSLHFYIKGSGGLNPCDRCDPIWTVDVLGSLEAFGCCDCFLWGFARYKKIALRDKSYDLWDSALGISPGFTFCGTLIYLTTGCDSWTKESRLYIGFRIRSLVFPGEITGKAYILPSEMIFSGFGLGFNLRL